VALLARCTRAQAATVRRALRDRGVLPPAPIPRRRFPALKPAPRQPWLAEGACVGLDPTPWTDPQTPAEREYARHLCRDACPVVLACREWALTSLPDSDHAIYGGCTHGDRERIRAARQNRPIPFSRTTAGKNAARDRRRRAAAQRAATQARRERSA
jgi:hypothetical protein